MIQTRHGVFETNSSSTHTLTFCSDDEYKKLENEELFLYDWKYEVLDKEAILQRINEHEDTPLEWEDIEDRLDEYDVLTLEDYCNFSRDLEFYHEEYTTPGGEVVHAFGHYT